MHLVEALFDHLPRAPFFVKDLALRYVSANTAMVRLCGLTRREDLIGKSAADFFTPELAAHYEEQDRLVLATGKPIKDRLEMTMRNGAHAEWLLYSRWPVLGANSAVVGVAATSRNLESPDRRHPTYQRLADVVQQMQQNFASSLRLPDLAERAQISVSQLERDFFGVFGMSPNRYISKLRVEAALERLQTDEPIASIAQACGYADQSAFTRRFTESVGMPPSAYRKTLEIKQR